MGYKNTRIRPWTALWFFLCVSCVVVFRPGQTEAGLLLHRHLLPQQHLRVRLLLLPTGVTVCSLPLLPAQDQGNKVVFLAPSTRKKKKKTKNYRTKASFDCFPLCHTAASKPVKRPTLPVRSPSLPREKRWRQAVTVIARAPSSLSSCVIPSLVAHFGDYRRKIPLFLCAFPVTHCCSVIMLAVPVECFNPSNKKTVVDFSGNVSLKRMKKGENTKNCRDFYEWRLYCGFFIRTSLSLEPLWLTCVD